MNKNNEFDQIFNIMKQSFPKSEFRSYENQKAVFNNDNYHVITSKGADGKIDGFLSFWRLESMNFIEHIAVKSEFRGKGIGSGLINKFFSQTSSSAILEVEVPSDEIKKRRIKFYQRLGFFLNLYFYSQPSFIRGECAIPMYIMSYPSKINFSEFIDLRKNLDTTIYFV